VATLGCRTTFAWLNRSPVGKDFEKSRPETRSLFLHLASIRLMLRKLCLIMNFWTDSRVNLRRSYRRIRTKSIKLFGFLELCRTLVARGVARVGCGERWKQNFLQSIISGDKVFVIYEHYACHPCLGSMSAEHDRAKFARSLSTVNGVPLFATVVAAAKIAAACSSGQTITE